MDKAYLPHLLRDHVHPDDYHVLSQIYELTDNQRDILSSATYDGLYQYGILGTSDNVSNKKISFYQELQDLREILSLWIVKFSDWAVPTYGYSYRKNENIALWLSRFDHGVSSIIRYLERCGKRSKYDLLGHVLVSVERYWYQYNSSIPTTNISIEFDNYIDEIIACHWYYRVLDLKYGFSDHVMINQNHFYKALEYGEYRFWVIQIVPAISNTDIIKRAEMPIAVDLFDIDKEIISDIIWFQDTEDFFSLDRDRLIFTYRDNPWPKIWFPSKSRIYYPGWYVLDTNICDLKPIQIKRKWFPLATANIVAPDIDIYIRQPEIIPKIVKLKPKQRLQVFIVDKKYYLLWIIYLLYIWYSH